MVNTHTSDAIIRLDKFFKRFDQVFPPVEYDQLVRCPKGYECDHYVVSLFLINLFKTTAAGIIVPNSLKNYTYNNIKYSISKSNIDYVIHAICAGPFYKNINRSSFKYLR